MATNQIPWCQCPPGTCRKESKGNAQCRADGPNIFQLPSKVQLVVENEDLKAQLERVRETAKTAMNSPLASHNDLRNALRRIAGEGKK